MNKILPVLGGVLVGVVVTSLVYTKSIVPKELEFSAKPGVLSGKTHQLNSLNNYLHNYEDKSSICTLIQDGEESRKKGEEN